VNPISKDEIINRIVEIIRVPFEERGFSLKRKRFFECEDSYGNVQQYEIKLSKLKGYFSLHLILNILNKRLLKKVNAVLEKVLFDDEYPFHESWNDDFIKGTIKTRVNNFFLTGLTDWKCFKEKTETLEEFSSRFFIWLRNFDDIDEIEEWESQLLQSVEFATKWFSSTAKDDEWVIGNTEYPALLLLKEKNRIEELTNKYEQILSQTKRKEETKLFYKHLFL
jgi:hypothetical protein